MRKVRHLVCTLDDLAEGVGTVLPLGEHGDECALFKTEGRVYAVGGLCPHQNTSLNGAPLQEGAVVCLRHGYRFDPKTGDCLTIGGYGVPVYEVEVELGMVYVSYWEYDE